jgi:hypothetical protein
MKDNSVRKVDVLIALFVGVVVVVASAWVVKGMYFKPSLCSLRDETMPSLVGLGYKDMIYICESAGLKVNTQGRGKVAAQSIVPGQAFVRGQQIQVTLN